VQATLIAFLEELSLPSDSLAPICKPPLKKQRRKTGWMDNFYHDGPFVSSKNVITTGKYRSS